MPSVEKDIEVNAPVSEVYQRWTEYETFPQFMENIKEVRRLGNDRTHWVAEAAGQKVEWDADTILESNRRVAWNAQGESGQSGEIRFEPIGADRTRVHVKMDYRLNNKLQEGVASGFGIDDRVVSKDLQNFKEMMEGGRLR